MRVLFLAPTRYVATMTFACEAILDLAARGHHVDVLVSSECHPPFDLAAPRVVIERFPDSLTSPLRGLFAGLRAAAERRFRAQRYDLLVGLSQAGVIIAHRLAARHGLPYVYFNDEIWFGDGRAPGVKRLYGRMIKWLECRANRGAAFTVTQDPLRGRHLADVNRIPIETMRFLPNSPRGPAFRQPSTFLHEHLRLPAAARIVLWCGRIAFGDGADELATSALRWPSDLFLVFHFPAYSWISAPRRRRIMEIHGQGQVRVTDLQLGFQELDPLFRSAFVGIVFYEGKTLNTRLIGHSSGKLNSFLRAGVPCIVNDYEGLRWVQEGGAGIAVGGAEGVLDAVQRIAAGYDAFSRAALELFERELSFSRKFAAIAEEMERRAGGP